MHLFVMLQAPDYVAILVLQVLVKNNTYMASNCISIRDTFTSNIKEHMLRCTISLL